VKDVPAKSGAEADETILKKDLAAAEAPAADTVDSDKAKAMFAAHEPSPNAAAHEPSPNAAAHEPSPKLARPTMPTAPTGAIKKDIPAAKSGAAASFDETGAINDPALKPVTEDVPAFLPVTAGGAPLPSIKEFPEEKPAPAVSALLSVLRLGAALLIQSCFR